MKLIFYFFIFLLVVSCNRKSSEIVISEDLKIEPRYFINDSIYLKKILPPFDLRGDQTNYRHYIGKFLMLSITNRTDSIIYLYSKAYCRWPIDTLVNRSIRIDSFFVSDKYKPAFDSNFISETFDTFQDSIIPGNIKERLVYFDKGYGKLKGTISYGMKSKPGDFTFKNQTFSVTVDSLARASQ